MYCPSFIQFETFLEAGAARVQQGHLPWKSLLDQKVLLWSLTHRSVGSYARENGFTSAVRNLKKVTFDQIVQLTSAYKPIMLKKVAVELKIYHFIFTTKKKINIEIIYVCYIFLRVM